MKIKKGVYKLGEETITIDMVAGQIEVTVAGRVGVVATFVPVTVRANSERMFFEGVDLAISIFGARAGKPNQPNCSQMMVSQLVSEVNRFAFANA